MSDRGRSFSPSISHDRLKPVPQVRQTIELKPDLWHRLQPVIREAHV
jgi:hypothetical protein